MISISHHQLDHSNFFFLESICIFLVLLKLMNLLCKLTVYKQKKETDPNLPLHTRQLLNTIFIRYWHLINAGRRRFSFLEGCGFQRVKHGPVRGHVTKSISAAQIKLNGIKKSCRRANVMKIHCTKLLSKKNVPKAISSKAGHVLVVS